MDGTCWGNEYRTTIVCVDTYEHEVLQGRLYNAALQDARQFKSTVQFLLSMETLLDGMNFPQHFNATRRFREIPPVPLSAAALPGVAHGKRASFAVKVLFRQNASWQGSVTWLEKRREETFRSVLEFLLLMHSALCEKAETA